MQADYRARKIPAPAGEKNGVPQDQKCTHRSCGICKKLIFKRECLNVQMKFQGRYGTLKSESGCDTLKK